MTGAPRLKPFSMPALAFLIGLIFGLLPLSVSAFVFLDTSADKPSASPVDSASREAAPGITISPTDAKPATVEPKKAVSISMPSADSGLGRKHLPHYGSVLFLSADDNLAYAYLGVLKALEGYGLDVDLILTESRSTFIAAAWALGYSAANIEKRLQEDPLGPYLKPFPDKRSLQDQLMVPDAKDPLQWRIPLSLQTFVGAEAFGKDVPPPSGGEYLHLSWMVARLTHDAPSGPVEDLAATPKPMAVQVSDLSRDEASVVTEGSLQNLLKGALLPPDLVRKRPNLSPWASGSLLSGNKVLTDRLPFTFDRLIVVEPGRNLRPPSLDGVPLAWMDSLSRSRIRGPLDPAQEERLRGKIVRIELEPDGEFHPEEPDPQKWIQLGYVSALRSMDVLQSILTKPPEMGNAPGTLPPPPAHANLGLNRVTVNPLASGGRQLLLDIIRTSDNDRNDSVGDASIGAIIQSGFYSDLDLEWTRAVGEENASLVFDAKEKSQIQFRAGWNAALTQADITDRGPELYVGLEWGEPFYIPFRTEAGALLGGNQPGYEFRAMITPFYPLRLDLGVSATHWDIHYPRAPGALLALDPIYFDFLLRRDLSEVFLKIYPTSGSYLRTSIQKHEMNYNVPEDPVEGSFLSTDFEETAFLGLGQTDRAGIFRNSLRLRYRNLNRVNLFGPVRYSMSNFESRLRLSLGDFRLSDQYFWSDQDTQESTLFDLMETGRIDVFSFQDEYFLGTLRSTNFQDVKVEYCPVFGKAGLRLSVGGYRQYGQNAFFQDQVSKPLRGHWEIQAGYATPVGVLRAGMGSLVDGPPVFFLKLGADLGLGFGEAD